MCVCARAHTCVHVCVCSVHVRALTRTCLAPAPSDPLPLPLHTHTHTCPPPLTHCLPSSLALLPNHIATRLNPTACSAFFPYSWVDTSLLFLFLLLLHTGMPLLPCTSAYTPPASSLSPPQPTHALCGHVPAAPFTASAGSGCDVRGLRGAAQAAQGCAGAQQLVWS